MIFSQTKTGRALECDVSTLVRRAFPGLISKPGDAGAIALDALRDTDGELNCMPNDKTAIVFMIAFDLALVLAAETLDHAPTVKPGAARRALERGKQEIAAVLMGSLQFQFASRQRPTDGAQNAAAAVDSAIAMARSAALVEIDWTKEPLTERERAVRLKILRRPIADSNVAWFVSEELDAGSVKMASDFEKAYAVVSEGAGKRDAAERRREIENAAREVDGLPPLHEDDYSLDDEDDDDTQRE
jgi:hypothetical protein